MCQLQVSVLDIVKKGAGPADKQEPKAKVHRRTPLQVVQEGIYRVPL